MVKRKKIAVKGTEITILNKEHNDYISLTDLAKYRDAGHTDEIIKNWLRNRNTIELLGFWEQLNNPNFKPVEFDRFRKQSKNKALEILLLKNSPGSKPINNGKI